MNKKSYTFKNRKLIALNSSKSRKAFVMLVVMLLQIFMPIMKVEAATYTVFDDANFSTREYNLHRILYPNDTYTLAYYRMNGALVNRQKVNWKFWADGVLLSTNTTADYSYTYTVSTNKYYEIGSLSPDFSSDGTLTIATDAYLNTLYKINFNYNGGSGSPTFSLIKNGDNYSNLVANGNSHYTSDNMTGLPNATRTNYTFAGWYTAATGGTKVTNSTTFNGTSDTTLYAHWTLRSSYTVNENLIYNGQEQVGVTYSDVTMTGTDKATNAGTYTVTLTPNEGYVWEDETTETKEVTWSISPATVTIPTLSNTSKSYTGSEQAPTIAGFDSNTMTQTGTASTSNTGEYTITWSLKDKTNYKWSDGTTEDKSATWSISPINISDDIIKFEDDTVEYNGTAHSIKITGNLNGGTIKYSTDGTNYSETLPTYTNVGEYTIYYKASKANYNDKTGSAKLTITKRPITVTANDKTITYGDSAPTFDYTITSDKGLAGDDTLSNITFSGTNQTNAGEYPIVISQSTGANPNYDISFINGTYKINKKAATPVVTLSQDTFTYNKEEQKPTVYVKVDGVDLSTDEYTKAFTTDSTNVGSKKVTITSTNQNYTFEPIEKTYTINAKSIDSSMVTIQDSQYVFDNTIKTPTVTLTDADYNLVKDTDYEIVNTSTTSATNPRDYSIIVKGKGNYKDEYTIPWTITKAAIQGVTINGVNTVYDGTNKEIDVTIPSNAKITYRTNTQDEYSNTKPTFKDAGNYTVYYKIEIDDNYTVIENSVPVIITPKAVTVTADNKEKIYGEEDKELTYTAEGLIENETLEGITLSREVGEDVGDYTITTTKNTTKDTNYNITTQDGTYTINKKTITEDEIKEMVTIENQVYTKEKVEPEIVIKDGDKIVPNTEYTVKYSDNVKPGIAKVTIKNAEGGNYIIDTTELTFVIIDPGVISFTEPKTPNSNNAKVLESAEEIISKIELTEEDIYNIQHGKNIDVYLEVKDISESVSNSDKKAIEEKLGKDTLGLYLDISLFKKIEGEDATKITETKEPITISFEIPQKLINKNSKVERKFKVLRLHDGKVEEIEVKVNGTKAIFETDKFSTYALTYEDIIQTSNPKTGDNIGTSFIMLIISSLGLMSALGYTVISKKRKLVKTNN